MQYGHFISRSLLLLTWEKTGTRATSGTCCDEPGRAPQDMVVESM